MQILTKIYLGGTFQYQVQRVGRGFRRALAQIPHGKIRQVRSFRRNF